MVLLDRQEKGHKERRARVVGVRASVVGVPLVLIAGGRSGVGGCVFVRGGGHAPIMGGGVRFNLGGGCFAVRG